MAETKTLRRILERIRDDAQQALSVLGDSEEQRALAWRCSGCVTIVDINGGSIPLTRYLSNYQSIDADQVFVSERKSVILQARHPLLRGDVSIAGKRTALHASSKPVRTTGFACLFLISSVGLLPAVFLEPDTTQESTSWTAAASSRTVNGFASRP
jgi:hypothetical protein